jgi:5'-3' exonuclease
MGISNLNKFLRNNCPQIYEEIHISEYSYKKVAIDISLYLCKFKTVCGDRWLSAFINLISCLRKNEVHCVFIYDSGCVPEKEPERRERALQREKIKEKVFKLEEALEKFHLTGEIDNILIELNKKNNEAPKSLLHKKEEHINMHLIESCIIKMKSQIIDISPKDFRLTKELFKILNVPFFHAPLEAETTCSDLCKRGLVDAVLSEDTDVLAYGCPVFLSKINTTDGTCIRIKYPDMLDALSLQTNEFLDLCIMCGTDYNKNIYKIGPEKAYKYIKKHSSIDNIGISNPAIDICVLNHIRIRQLFREYEELNIKIPYCGMPDFQLLTEFIFKNNIKYSMEAIKRCFINQIIVFEEEVEEEKKEEVEEIIEEIIEEIEEEVEDK